MGTTVIGVAIVEDHPLSRQGLKQIIEDSAEMELVVTTSSVHEIEDAGYAHVQVVLLDLHLPDAEGADAVSRVKAHVPAVLAISASYDHQEVIDAIGAGANGYIKKGAGAGEILKAVTAVAKGGAYVSPMLAAHLLRNGREISESSEFSFSDQDRALLSLVAQGEPDVAIAGQLSMDMATMHAHLDRIRAEAEQRSSR